MTSKFLTAVCAFALGVAWAAPARANEYARATQIKQYGPNVRKRDYVRIPGATVAFANYKRIREDWPATRGLSNHEIDQRLLKRFAFISKLQLKLRGIRTTMFAYDDTDVKTFAQPLGWNRAAIEGEDDNDRSAVNEIADVKGSGQGNEISTDKQVHDYQTIIATAGSSAASLAKQLNELRTLDHSDGLMTLGEALAETTRQMAAQRLFDRYNSVNETSYQTVETYFVIALPIEIYKKDGETKTAALYGRQAHLGRDSGLIIPHGLFIDGHGGMQHTRFDSSVDFGGVQISAEDYATTFGFPKKDPQQTNAWSYGQQTADAFAVHWRAGRIDEARLAVSDHIETMLSPVKPTPDSPDAEFNYYKFRLRSLTAGSLCASRIVRNFDRLHIARAGHETDATGLAFLLTALATQKKFPDLTSALVPEFIKSLVDGSAKALAPTLALGLRVDVPYAKAILREALLKFQPRTLVEAFDPVHTNLVNRASLFRDLVEFSAQPKTRSAAVAVLRKLIFQVRSPLEGLDRAAIETLRDSSTEDLKNWATTALSAKDNICRDLFARTTRKLGP